MRRASQKLTNRLQLNTSYLRRESFSKGLPTELTIELTNRCNLGCIMCPRSKMEREIGFMDIDLFKKVIDEAAAFAELVDFDLYGESTFHPQLITMISYAHKRGLKTLLSTNMTVMTEEKMNRLIDSGLDMLYISIDGAKRSTYESIRVGGNYQEVVENTERFLSMKKKRKPYTIIQMIHMIPNQDEVQEFLRQWERKADAVRIKPYLTLDPQTNNLAVNLSSRAHKPCIMPWRRVVICWDGSVVPCCNDYDTIYLLGNVRENSIEDIWNGKRIRDLRSLHVGGKKNEIGLCKGCKPFEASSSVVLASTLTQGLTIRKLLPRFERNVIRGKSTLFRYS